MFEIQKRIACIFFVCMPKTISIFSSQYCSVFWKILQKISWQFHIYIAYHWPFSLVLNEYPVVNTVVSRPRVFFFFSLYALFCRLYLVFSSIWLLYALFFLHGFTVCCCCFLLPHFVHWLSLIIWFCLFVHFAHKTMTTKLNEFKICQFDLRMVKIESDWILKWSISIGLCKHRRRHSVVIWEK